VSVPPHLAPRFITPDWPAPPGVRAAFTLREGGVSLPPFDTLNVGAHVGDAAEAVSENRRRVSAQLALPAEPAWIEQVHGTEVLELGARAAMAPAAGSVACQPAAPVADAVIARRPGEVCAIQVADCLPVLLAARDASVVGAAHAGWRGLAAGVLEATVRSLGVDPAGLLAWLGPAIGVGHFEVGDEVRAALLTGDAGAAAAFAANARGRWQCDLTALARRRLSALGLHRVFGGTWCTFADRAHFFSYRRDGRCGRMAALVWLA
jgi:polyphenol oxidase